MPCGRPGSPVAPGLEEDRRGKGDAGQAAGQRRRGPAAAETGGEGLAASCSTGPTRGLAVISSIASVRWGPIRRAIWERLEQEQEVSIRRALLLCLGEFGLDRLPASERKALVPAVFKLYRDDPDPGLHAAAEWLLRQWKQQDRLEALEQEWKKDERARLKTEHIRRTLQVGKPQWYINGQGQTMVVVPGPVEFLMGSPTTEADRPAAQGAGWSSSTRKIDRSFAIAAKEVTVAQFRKFREELSLQQGLLPTADMPDEYE